jgi:tetrapyrrole methylase family protein/MazG family protein
MANIKDFKEKRALYKLEELASILHGEDGCPWDREQTHDSLKKYLIEETYEVIDAIESGDSTSMREELGDLLYQIYAHSHVTRDFTIDEIAEGIFNKLYHRHPHVFSDASAETPLDVENNWERIKKKEREGKSILSGVPNHLPALIKAYRVQQKVSRVGFDFSEFEDTITKLEEELEELKAAVKTENKDEIMDEFGDILFSIVNIARFIELDPEEALRKAVDKFKNRFEKVEEILHIENRQFDDVSLEELEALWQKVKNE